MAEPNLIQSPDKKNMTNPNKPSTYTQSILTQTTNTPSFASKVASEQLPKRELAIVFNTIENIPQIEYLIALSKLISPKDITYASRVSNGRFCVYLSNKNTIDNLIENHQNIIVNNQIINIRRLINPAKKLILSNVCPTIPNSIIESSLNNAGFTLVSPIIKLRAGFNIEGFTHIMSFKRQIFVKPDDFENKPTSIIINHEDIAYRIFINDDMVTCFHCKLKGHISNQCPNLKTQLVQNETHNIAIPETKINENMILDNEPNPESNEDINKIRLNIAPPTGIKRPAPSTSPPSSSPSSPNNETSNGFPMDHTSQNLNENDNSEWTIKTTKKQQKKRKRTPSLEHFIANLNISLKPAEKFFERKTRAISFIQFKDMIENSQENNDIIETVLQYCDIQNAINIIEIVTTAFITDRSLKTRLGKLLKILKAHLQSS